MVTSTEPLRSERASTRARWVLIAFALLSFLPVPAAAQEPAARNVLLVFSHERERALYDALDNGLRSTLQSNAHTVVNS